MEKSPFLNWKYYSKQKMEINVPVGIGSTIAIKNGNNSSFKKWN